METLSYQNFVLEATELAKSKKRRPYVRILNLAALILASFLLPLCIEALQGFDFTKNDVEFFLLWIIIAYTVIIYLINSYLFLPVKINSKNVETALKETFKKKEEYFLSEVNINRDRVDYYKDKLLGSEEDVDIALNNLRKFQKIQSLHQISSQ